MNHIRNFCIIAHIDHGKSTLADRLLEITGTIDKRKMKDQYLDQLELERERGITIKMAPVRMRYAADGRDYILNLIDTPGHPDFGYEVSRALEAVEGAILLVDATQGIQAQTISNFYAAQKAGLTIIGAVNKIDMAAARVEETIEEICQLTGQSPEQVFRISGKTGEGAPELLRGVIDRIPPPAAGSPQLHRALIFDSFYDDHKGIIAAIRVTDGSFRTGDDVQLLAANEHIKLKEAGFFSPTMLAADALSEGEIGYVVTGLKDPHKIKIGDTVLNRTSKVDGAKHLQLP